MAKKRVTRKELLKEPDEFMTFTGKVIQFVRSYQQYIIYGTSFVILIGLIVSGYRYYHGWQERKSYTLLEEAIKRYEAMDDKKENLSTAKQEFQTLVEKYSGYSGGKMGRVIYANICYDSGDYDLAIDQYKKALIDFADQPSFKTFIQSSIGYAYQAKKNYQAAAEQFEAMVSNPAIYMKDEALFNLGLLYAKLGKPEKSREAFQKIITDYADSSYVEIAKERLAS